MANVSKLRPAKSPEPSSRAALVAALKELKAARGSVNRQKEAMERLFAQQVEAQAAIEPAEKAVKKAEAAYIDAVAEAAASGSPEPVSGVPEAMAALAFKRDRVHTLRAARKVIEEELPDWEAAAVEADTEVEKIISQIIADHVQVIVKEARELARRIGPYRAALLAFLNEDRPPTEWAKQSAWHKGREPLTEATNEVADFFRSLRAQAPPSPCWKTIRESLRENPNAPLLRPLVEEFAGLLDRPTDEPRPEPA
jgi:hypothetical protein